MATKKNHKPLKSETEQNVLEQLPDDDITLSQLVVERWAKNPDAGRMVAEVLAAFGDRALHGLGRLVVSVERIADAVDRGGVVTGNSVRLG